jgi:hypothetical protein
MPVAAPSRRREQSEARSAPNSISPREIETALQQRVDSLVPELLPAARADGRFWVVGSVDGEPGQTLKINRSGARQGCWTDFNAGAHPDARSGDMLKLIAIVRFGGWSQDGAKAKSIGWAKSWLGWDSLDPDRLETVRREAVARAAANDAAAAEELKAKRTQAEWLWNGAIPIARVERRESGFLIVQRTPAFDYLAARLPGFEALVLARGRVPGSLRYRPDVWCRERRGKHPAMIACIMGLNDGSLLGVHRTYLDISRWDHATRRGPVSKAKVENPKLSLGHYAGGCIPLWKGASPATLREIPAGTAVYASEGIEDGLSVALAAPELRVVAGVALANLGALALPEQAGELVLIGQNDPIGSKAVDAFERVVARQQAAGRRVRLMFPKPEYKDFNDQLLGKPIAAARP